MTRRPDPETGAAQLLILFLVALLALGFVAGWALSAVLP